MKVFASSFLKSFSSDKVESENEWSWEPKGSEAKKIYASGASTSTSQSTYAAEKDNRSDNDRPNEGMLVA